MTESTKNGQKTEMTNEQQTKVKLNNINLAELQKQHKIYQLYAEISEYRLRQVIADTRYIEFVAKFNSPPANAEVPLNSTVVADSNNAVKPLSNWQESGKVITAKDAVEATRYLKLG